MGNKPLIGESKLSWIRDTSVESPTAKDEAHDPPKHHEAKAPKEPAARTATEPVRHSPAKAAAPDARNRNEVNHGTRRAPEYSTSPLTYRRTMGEESFQGEPLRPEMRQPQPQRVRQEMYYPDGSGQGAEQGMYPKVRKPAMIHYWLALVALIAVAITPIPDRYTILVFLGFIFVILLEISYRVGQHYHQDKLNTEYLQRFLHYMRQEERGDRQGPRSQ